MNELMHNGIPVHYDENPNFLSNAMSLMAIF